MAVSDDLFDALSTIPGVDGVYDTKLPDNYMLSGSVLVFSSVSDVPEDVGINGEIIRHVSRWQVSIHALDLTRARALKESVISVLHGYAGGSIVRADYESCPGELFESNSIPFQYHIPIDFMVQS